MPNTAVLRDVMLVWMADHTRPGSANCHPQPFLTEFGVDETTGQSIIRMLVFQGLLEAVFDYDDGCPDGRVTARGAREADRLRQLRADAAAVHSHARRELLRWLYDRAMAGEQSPRLTDFARTDGAWHAGARLTEEAIERASLALRNDGFIEGPGAWGHGVPRPRLTNAGTACVEDYGGDVSRYRRSSTPQGGTHLTINGGVNNSQLAVGEYATQTNHISGLDAQALAVFARALQQGLSELNLSPENEAEANDALSEVQAESRNATPDPERLRVAFQRVLPFLAGAAAPVASHLMMQAVMQVGQIPIG